MAGPFPYPEPFPQQPHPGPVPSAYPGMLPPPVNYPKASRRKRFVLIAVLAVALAAAVVAVVLVAPNTRRDQGVVVTAASATTAIQDYLDALIKGDDQTVARNNSCGFFDAVKDRRSDMTLANLTSDAFRRQYDAVRVSTIDKIVTWSPTQAQVLFTMRATPAGRSQGEVERQGIAQLLVQDREILVCSYLPRNSDQF
jgi:hypothetical protein